VSSLCTFSLAATDVVVLESKSLKNNISTYVFLKTGLIHDIKLIPLKNIFAACSSFQDAVNRPDTCELR
jgi:hypothetical protein